MSSIFYEIRRILRSKFVIVMIVAIIGLSSLLSYESGSTYKPVSVPSGNFFTYGYYFSHSNLTVVGYVYNSYGKPVKGVSVSYSYNKSVFNAVTDGNGFANVTFPADISMGKVNVTANMSYKVFRSTTTLVTHISIPTNVPYSGLSFTSSVFNPTNNTRLGLLFLYVGSNGSAAHAMNFLIAPVNTSNASQLTSSYVIDHYQFNISESGFNVAIVFPPVTYSDHNNTYAFVVMESNKLVMPISSPSYAIPIGKLTLYKPLTQSALQQLVNSGTSGILNFFIPILAVFSGYLTYGKDRTTGVMESVLKRPITRGGLISSRFLANSVAIAGAVIASMAIADLIIYHYFSMFVSPSFFLYFIWTYIVEGLAFLALVYLFSHLVSSQGALLGAAIALFIVMDLFWTIIPLAVLAAFGVNPASDLYMQVTVAFNYASPAGYSSLVQAIQTGTLSSFASSSVSAVSAALFGVTVPLVLLAGVLWIALPFIAAYYLAVTRD
ncbi:MAG: ABC transporter permease subunit [Thermoplasmataceae archaeon]